jgi:hypothetical protein
VTISEIKERLQRINEPLYRYYRREYRKWRLDVLTEALPRMEADLRPEIWNTSIEWDYDEDYAFDSYTRCQALRDELAERLGYLEREFIQEQVGYDS